MKKILIQNFVVSCLLTIKNYSSFKSVFTDVLNRHALIKKKVVIAKHVSYVTKALRKAITKKPQDII